MVDITRNPPNYEISVNNKSLPLGIKRLIQGVEFESVDGIADLIKINLVDHFDDKHTLIVRDSKVFAMGNQVGVFMGYGPKLAWMGGVIIKKVRMSYPRTGNPTMELIGYTRDSEMSDNAPQPPKEQKDDAAEAKVKRPKRKSGLKQGRRFAESRYDDAVSQRAEAYNFVRDVDFTHDEPHDFIQKTGLSDYDFIKGIANLTGFYFWVDMDKDGIWTLHFKDPDQITPDDVGQTTKYTFKWNEGDFTTLLNFEPELAIQGQTNKLSVVMKDPLTGAVRTVEVVENADGNAPEIISPEGPGQFNVQAANQLKPGQDTIEAEFTTPGDVKLLVGDFSFQVNTSRTFATEAEVANWARNWFARMRDNFILARAQIIGVETLRARQIHRLEGLGTALSGDYYINSVRHLMTKNGYFCDCSVRKLIPSPKPLAATSTNRVIRGSL